MHWNYDFDIGALVIIAILIVFYFVKGYQLTQQNRIFFYLIILIAVNIVLDVATSVLCEEGNPSPVWLKTAVTTIYFFLQQFMTPMYFVYLLKVIHRPIHLRQWRRLLLFLPTLATLILSLLSPVFGCFFWIDETGLYHYGSLRWAEFIVAAFYAFCGVHMLILNRKQVKRIQFYAVLSFVIFTAVCLLLQFFLVGDYLLVNFAAAISVIVMYFTLQNPDGLIDTQTGLLNVDAFFNMMFEQMEWNHPCTVLVLRLNNYRELMQVYERNVNRELLTGIANGMRSVTGRGFSYALSSDLFALVFSSKERLNELLSHKGVNIGINSEEFRVYLQFSSAVIECPQYAKSPEEFLNLAEYVLSLNGAVLHTIVVGEAELEGFRQRQNIVHALNAAIQENAVEVFFQPIYSVEKQRIVAAEALARIPKKEGGYLSPDLFIPIAERNGSIVQLGEQVLRKTCAFIAEHHLERYGIEHISVNLSVVQCMQPDVAKRILDIVRFYDISPSMLALEITESVSMDRLMENNTWVQYLKDYGISFLLDDYGTGYSNISSILRLPFSYIKLDRSILLSYFEGDNYAFVSILKMLHQLHYAVIAEGAETEEQLNLLKENECELIQGYYFSKPLPGSAFLSYLNTMNGPPSPGISWEKSD